MHAFSYHRPQTLDEAQALLGTDAAVFAGGQTLLPLLKERTLRPAHIVDIKRVLPNAITLEDGQLVIGAGATHAQIATNNLIQIHAPTLAALADHVGDPAVRHRGTLGGSLVANHPAGDWPAAALALDAVLHTTRRTLAFHDYADGSAALSTEIVLRIVLRLPANAAYVKLLHPAQRYAIVGAFVATTEHGPRIAVTGLATAGAFRWQAAEAQLAADFTPAALDGLEPVTAASRDDPFATPRYRQHLARVLTQRAIDQLTGGAPHQVAIVHGQAR